MVYDSQNLIRSINKFNKKVLMRERKRHTARRVASTRCAALSGGWGGVTQSQIQRGGTQSQARGGTQSQVWGVPGPRSGGVPSPRSRGYPIPGPGGYSGYPPYLDLVRCDLYSSFNAAILYTICDFVSVIPVLGSD